MEKETRKRFWKKVQITPTCWLWKAATNGRYGVFTVNRIAKHPHRLVWQMVHGDIPKNLYVCHKCDNKLCVRPSHLFLGTAKDNSLDAALKGRHKSKLKPQQVREIRALWQTGVSAINIAARFGVNNRRVYGIIKGEDWKHVT